MVWQDESASGKSESPTTRAAIDGDAATIQRMLDNVRNISGNSRCVDPQVTTINALNDTVYVSGAKILSGRNAGMYLWRISVRPGVPGETITLTQNSRSDIPKTLVVNDQITTETPHGNRGVWLITKSYMVPNYQIS